jgi:acetyl-CoA acetyltransferase
MTQVHVLGVGSTDFGRHPAASVKDLTGRALQAALRDADIEASDIQSAYFANSTQGFFEGQHAIRGPIALRHAGLSGIPIVSVEAACAGGAVAFLQAVQAIRAGAAEVVLAIGAEKMFWPDDRQKMMAAFDGGWDVADPAANRARLLELSPELAPAHPEGGRSVFMDVYAAFCAFHMNRFGTTREQLAAVSSKNHCHSVHNPLAQHRSAMTAEQILAAREVVWPLTVPMCAPASDGAAAVIVASEDFIRRRGLNRDRSPLVAATVMQTGIPRKATDYEHHVSRLAAVRAYEFAGVSPREISVAEVHDATSMGEIIQSEMLGFCAIGEGGPTALRGETSIGGRIPINPSGGLESKGHPVGATGLGQIHELALQLRGEAGARQVENARVGVAENGGGLIGIEEAVCAVTILVSAASSRRVIGKELSA